MNFKSRFLPFVLCLFMVNSGYLFAQNDPYRVAFYNVENLFDTINNPLKNDNQYTPDTPMLWGTERYSHKISALSLVVQELGFPAILGLCEIENETVLSDWAAYKRMKPHNYRFIIEESSDRRGMDVALMYKEGQFFPISHSTHFGDFAAIDNADYTTRDILYVKGTLPNADTVHLFVTHFPSRIGGVAQTEPNRITVAQKIKYLTDSLQQVHSNPNILILGDFNDNPGNASIRSVLSACHPRMKAECNLINPFWELYETGHWTYNFRGNLDMLDQIIVSSNLYFANEGLRMTNAAVFKELWMLYHHPQNGFTPNRTYVGRTYAAGFSDHLPVYIDLSWE